MSSSRRSPSSTPFRSIASQMTPADEVAVAEASAAELRGDWATALARHRAVPMFAESQHGDRLALMAGLGDAAPDWLRARFLTTMAARLEMYGQPRRSADVLRRVMPVLYPHGVPFEAIGCRHVEQVGVWIFARDWVLRQANTYDLGGLRELLALPTLADPDVPGIEAWCDAPMGGWRLVSADGEVMVVADAATGKEVELLDLGLTQQHEVGTHLLGRLVPTTVSPGLLFDWRPLVVDEQTAAAVARRPERWLSVLATRIASRRLPEAFSHQRDTSIGSDLPQHSWGVLLGHPIDDDLPRPPRCLAADALRAALRLAADPAEADALHRRRHVISELLLDDALDTRTLTRFASPTYLASWQTLAAVLPSHAARRCDEAIWLAGALAPDELTG